MSFVYQPAYVGKAPLIPIKKVILVILALLFGLCCATCIALLKMWRSQKVQQPMDLAFIGVDTRSVCTSYPDAMARMRTMLMANPEQKVIYIADFDENKMKVEKLKQSFEAAGLSVEDISAPTNDMLLSPEISAKVAHEIQSGKYAFVHTPSATEIFMLTNKIEAPEAALVAFVPDTMNRHLLKKYLKGLTTSKIFVCIVDK